MKIGQLMECDFGDYTLDASGNPNIDGRIAPEMVKKRLAVVMNTKLDHGAIVVPISSSQDAGKVQRGLHIHISPALVTKTAFYDSRDRWALCDHVQHVNKCRLKTVRGPKGYVQDILPRDLVQKIQEGVMVAVNAGSLLKLSPVIVRAAIPERSPDAGGVAEAISTVSTD